ncbi:hypothetical protein HYX19_04435 [Candidatus Woesearchaeota archaeon]|nr:hypothetical protein [Candidatus Woesearchaeota archaeon]
MNKIIKTNAAKEIKLKKHIKFRKEKDYILLCDLKNLEDYELPPKYYSLLVDLKVGVKTSKFNSDLIKDLKNINALELATKNKD